LRPWRFVVIGSEGRARFGELLASHLRRTRNPISDELLDKERRKAFRAPLIIVVAAIIQPDSKIPVVEQILSAGAAAQSMLLTVFALGFNAVWKTGGPAYDDTVKQELGLQAKDAIVGFLYVGTDDPGPDRLPRPDWRAYVHHWG
jgi:nitroreductase